MRELVFNQKLSFKAQRESLREKGQFWTPEWITEPMVEYVLEGEATTLFDPAVGEGNFFHAAKTVAKEKGLELKLVGMEIDPVVLAQALAKGLEPSDISSVIIGDFTLHSPLPTFKAIVGNPPYIRHHRLSTEVKTQLRKMCIKIMGKPLDGRAGLHIYFLIRALSLLEDNMGN
jgi:type I restriction-modification system DNA methylase subunit